MNYPCHFCSGTPSSEKILPKGWVCEDVVVVESTNYVESFTGETNPLNQPFKSISIHKPDCCTLTVVLDGQAFVVPDYVNAHVLEFDCDITVLELIGDCVDTVTVTVANNCEEIIVRECTIDPSVAENILLQNEMSRFPCRFKYCPED